MPLILNIETSTTVCSVAISKSKEILSYKEINAGFTHAENLTVFIQSILNESGISLSNIDAIAVSAGPGSYTGLRIGVATAKGICYALNKPLIAVNTLEALIYSEKISKQKESSTALLCPMLDARRMEVYCALYNYDKKEIFTNTSKVIDENSFKDEIAKNKIIFFGDGAEKCKSILSHPTNTIFIDNVYPSARYMSLLSTDAFKKKLFVNPAYFEPFYLKEFYSEKK